MTKNKQNESQLTQKNYKDKDYNSLWSKFIFFSSVGYLTSQLKVYWDGILFPYLVQFGIPGIRLAIHDINPGRSQSWQNQPEVRAHCKKRLAISLARNKLIIPA
jgi:hypothetical protein